MIGKIIIGKSFRGCISYCLEKEQSEVLDYNFCYGDKKELIKQFNEVRNLNPKLQKPVLHITLSLPKGEQLTEAQLAAIAAECARDLGFEKNQYIVIQHQDTGHQHIHIVVNRVGFDGRTVKDSNNYRKMAEFCRKMELKYSLQKVLSPGRYLPREQRHLPRFDQRKEQLRQDIRDCLSRADNYSQFEELMKQKGYTIQKARGIAFIDSKKVRTKGSEVGYSLSKIEKILALPKEQKALTFGQDNEKQNRSEKIIHTQSLRNDKLKSFKPAVSKENSVLLKPGIQPENVNPALLKKKRQKKRKLNI